MILLDTNVVSEITHIRPNPAVQAWFEAQVWDELFLCTPVLAELRYGVERLPAGRRRNLLDKSIQQLVVTGFVGRILPVDRETAHEFGRIVAARYRSGRPISTMDGLIAAVAVVRGAIVATRDVAGFSGVGVDVINPFMTTG